MEIEKICYNCIYYKENEGRYNLGICENWLSKKRPKDLILKNDSCIRWENKCGKKMHKL